MGGDEGGKSDQNKLHGKITIFNLKKFCKLKNVSKFWVAYFLLNKMLEE